MSEAELEVRCEWADADFGLKQMSEPDVSDVHVPGWMRSKGRRRKMDENPDHVFVAAWLTPETHGIYSRDGKRLYGWEFDEPNQFTSGGNHNPEGHNQYHGGGKAGGLKALEGAEKEAYGNYAGMLYGPVNSFLRTGKAGPLGLPPGGKETIAGMDSAFKHSSLGEATTVYRRANLGKLKVGSTITDNGFISTTTDKGIAQRYSERAGGPVIAIKLPAGHPALSVGETFGEHANTEKEITLNRGSAFKVVSVTPSLVTLEPA